MIFAKFTKIDTTSKVAKLFRFHFNNCRRQFHSIELILKNNNDFQVKTLRKPFPLIPSTQSSLDKILQSVPSHNFIQLIMNATKTSKLCHSRQCTQVAPQPVGECFALELCPLPRHRVRSVLSLLLVQLRRVARKTGEDLLNISNEQTMCACARGGYEGTRQGPSDYRIKILFSTMKSSYLFDHLFH